MDIDEVTLKEFNPEPRHEAALMERSLGACATIVTAIDSLLCLREGICASCGSPTDRFAIELAKPTCEDCAKEAGKDGPLLLIDGKSVFEMVTKALAGVSKTPLDVRLDWLVWEIKRPKNHG